MLTKKFKSQKEAKLFKQQYSDMEFETEVISNILQPYYQDHYPEMKDYMNWLWNDSPEYHKVFALRMLCESFAGDILKSKFGKCDFTFEGNRKYENYVLESEGLTYITPAKREFVLSEGKKLAVYIPRIIRFEKEFQQFLFDAVMADFDNLPAYQRNNIAEIKKAGIITPDNKIDFDFVNKSAKKKKQKP